MTKPIASAVAALAALALVCSATAALAAKDNNKKKKPPAAGAPNEIACVAGGCVPVPRGCGQVPGKTYDDEPTGYAIIVCPAPRYR